MPSIPSRSALRFIAGVLSLHGSAAETCRSVLGTLTSSPAELVLSQADVALGQSPLVGRDTARQKSAPVLASTAIVADLRLDNHADLCCALDLDLSSSDDQVLAHAWARWGADVVDHLVGGFAFACWDASNRALFLARDHAGERPLHFARSPGPDGGFAFASMPLGLCAVPEVGRRIDAEYMAHFLAVVTPQDSRTFFHGVERLLPGELLQITPSGLTVRRYWHPSNAKPIRYRRDSEYIDDFRERFDRAVGAQLTGDRGFGSELSGGLDSSSVTAIAAKLLAADGRRITSFTAVPVAGFDGRALHGRFGNEGPFAAEVAALYPNIDHVLVDSAGRDLLETVARAARLTGQPVFNPTNQLWVDAILDGVRARGLGVVLQGVSGNATLSFGGLAGLSDLLRRGRLLTLYRQARDLRASGYTSWRAAASWATAPMTPQWVRRILNREMHDFTFTFSPIHPDRDREYGLKEKVLEAFFGADESSAATQRLMYDYFDPGVANGAAAAGWQVEQRDPTQHKSIYEFCFGIPVEQYLVGGQSRSLVRRAMQGRLPESTLRRNDRGQQAADWYLVMGAQRERLADELTRVERSPLAQHLIDLPRMRRLLETWPASGYESSQVNETWHLALSRGIAAGSFIANYE